MTCVRGNISIGSPITTDCVPCSRASHSHVHLPGLLGTQSGANTSEPIRQYRVLAANTKVHELNPDLASDKRDSSVAPLNVEFGQLLRLCSELGRDCD